MAATVTYEQYAPGEVECCTVTWTSNSAGAATATINGVRGEILGFQTNPSGASGLAPTDNYDITLTDRDGFDVLGGLGADRDQTNTERVDTTDLKDAASGGGYVLPAFPRPTVGPLAFAVAGAGAANVGVFRVWYRR